MFLHANIIHLFFNMSALNSIGSQLEGFIGRTKFLIVYLLSGLIGGLLTVALHGTEYVGVGASGAIFGLLGSLLYFGYHYRVYLGQVMKSQIIPVIIVNLAIGFMFPNIDNFAHIGGLLGGVTVTMGIGIAHKSTLQEKINGCIITLILVAFLLYLMMQQSF